MNYLLIQADKLWYNQFIPHSSVLTLPGIKYYVLMFEISSKSGIIVCITRVYVIWNRMDIPRNS